MKCTECGNKMNSGYCLKANTYGTISIERGKVKEGMPQVWVCPECGKVEIRVEVNH